MQRREIELLEKLEFIEEQMNQEKREKTVKNLVEKDRSRSRGREAATADQKK